MPIGVYQHKSNQVFQKGHKVSLDVRAKLSAQHRGTKKPWAGKYKRDPLKEEQRIAKMKGKKMLPQTRQALLKVNMGHKRKGWKLSPETRKKISEAHKGEKSYLWKGGVTPINEAIRHSFEYKEWRKSVFERDLYICQYCGQVGGYLEADHIKPFSLYPELRFELSNGRTYCKPCHKIIGWSLFRESNPKKYLWKQL